MKHFSEESKKVNYVKGLYHYLRKEYGEERAVLKKIFRSQTLYAYFEILYIKIEFQLMNRCHSPANLRPHISETRC